MFFFLCYLSSRISFHALILQIKGDQDGQLDLLNILQRSYIVKVCFNFANNELADFKINASKYLLSKILVCIILLIKFIPVICRTEGLITFSGFPQTPSQVDPQTWLSLN